ncbi:MAG: hypothetical protein M3Z14_03555 [Candidatus Eremiobacteraeota bacterium]|nr:hypothetical protein [Candidatus Eremiobacteraeota bacterium]
MALLRPAPLEQVSLKSGPNNDPADMKAVHATYAALKRGIGMRSVFLVALLACPLAVKVPILGLELALGGVCGILNMLLVMHGNERLVDGRRNKGTYICGSLLRVLVFGAVPVFVFSRAPWWAMGFYFGGFFLPLLLYTLALARVYRRDV